MGKELKIKIGYSNDNEPIKMYDVEVYINTETYDRVITCGHYMRACGPKQGICVIKNYCDDIMEFFNSDKNKLEKIKQFIQAKVYTELNENIIFENIEVETLKLMSGNLYINIQL